MSPLSGTPRQVKTTETAKSLEVYTSVLGASTIPVPPHVRGGRGSIRTLWSGTWGRAQCQHRELSLVR